MFCPECKAEYLPGVTRCSDCNNTLVEHLPESGRDSDGKLSDSKLQGVWSGEDQYDCVSICERLRDAKIPFKVIQHTRQFLKGVEDHYEIGVPPKFCKQAKEVIGSDRFDFSDEGNDQATMELPAQDDIVDAVKIDEDWEPENATAEIQVQSNPVYADMIESS